MGNTDLCGEYDRRKAVIQRFSRLLETISSLSEKRRPPPRGVHLSRRASGPRGVAPAHFGNFSH